MKKFSLIKLAACLFVGVHSVAFAQTKPWTFLVYLAGANNLCSFAYRDLGEMMRIGSNENINIIVYCTLQEEGEPKQTLRLYVEKDDLVQYGEVTAEDSGDVRTLMSALEWAEVDFPSEHTAVVLWNHGSGVLNRGKQSELRGICYDDETHNYLDDRDCLQAFSWAQRKFRDGKNYDIVACDACLMGMLEVAHGFGECADYFVASQETIPGNGYDYAHVLDEFELQAPTPRDFARSLVDAYQEEYEGTPDYTLSAVDLAVLSPLVANYNEVASVLLSALKGDQRYTVKRYIRKSCEDSVRFDYDIYVDLYGLYKNLLYYSIDMELSDADTYELQTLLHEGLTLINEAVIKKVSSPLYQSAGGLSVYFPQYYVEDSYYKLYWTQHNPLIVKLLEGYIAPWNL